MNRVGGLCLGLMAIASIMIPSNAAENDLRFEVSKQRYVVGTTVVIRLVNESDETAKMSDVWTIERESTNDLVAQHAWPPGKLKIDPGESRVWRWDQLAGGAAQVKAGAYVARVKVEGEARTDGFDIGQFFTLGFDSSNASFVVFVAKQKAMEKMEDEAQSEEKTLITSGKVKGGEPYNPDWSYTMGPHTIVLGEVFTEVCDASPEYVEENRADWLGQRWCPWSSYVDHVGK